METTQTPLQNIKYHIKVKEVSLLKFYMSNLYKYKVSTFPTHLQDRVVKM